MDRRTFITLSTAASAALALPAAAAQFVEYRPGLVEQELAAGKTLLLDFSATWCSTCAAQKRVIGALQDENPAYLQAITFVRIDWDQYKNDALTASLAIPRRSTLVVLKGDQELGRIVAGTGREQIKALLDVALGAATA